MLYLQLYWILHFSFEMSFFARCLKYLTISQKLQILSILEVDFLEHHLSGEINFGVLWFLVFLCVILYEFFYVFMSLRCNPCSTESGLLVLYQYFITKRFVQNKPATNTESLSRRFNFGLFSIKIH